LPKKQSRSKNFKKKIYVILELNLEMIKNIYLALFTILIVNSLIFGQMARKPSPTREPKGAMSKTPDSNKNSLTQIRSQKEFDSVGRTYHQGTPYAMPHVMFIIDRKNSNKIYYVNSQKFRFHKDFLFSTGLAPLGSDIYKAAYFNDDRRFIVGTIAWQKTVEKWTWELWEGDLAKDFHIKTANEVINKTFFQPVAYKPNSIRQEDVSANLELTRITQDDINKNQEYLALNTGEAVGRIHIIDKLDDTVEIGSNEIVVLKELPLNLPPVRAIIVAKPSTPLSHVNILARGWGVPNVYIKDADKLFKEFDTYVFKLDANLTNYKLTRATREEVDTKFVELPEQVPPVNLNVKKITALNEIRKKDSISFGGKSANLGEMLNAKIPGITVPDGFSIPFYWYAKFMKDNDLNKYIEEYTDDNDFVHNPRIRRKKLEEFRQMIQRGEFDESLKKEIIEKWKTQLGGKPVFIRSSSNSEDLPNFSGAGLYDSAKNVVTEQQFIDGVKFVWASLWKFEAYEARVRNFVSQKDVYMSAFVQIGVNMDRGGVMITKDPFDAQNKNTIYISVVCGHNSKIPDNKGIPEQVLFNPKSNSVVVMTLSQQENSLTFDANGELKETTDKCADKQTKRILNNLQTRSLAKTALAIRKVFGDKKEQDIEWGIMNGKVYIVQSRPYIEK
jgi:Pyruvate phosphate dikinase, AMP/ATP-binding domain